MSIGIKVYGYAEPPFEKLPICECLHVAPGLDGLEMTSLLWFLKTQYIIGYLTSYFMLVYVQMRKSIFS